MISRKVLMIACAIGLPGAGAVAQSVTDLQRARLCQRQSTMAYAAGDIGTSKIRMSNDGGWCWIDISATYASMQYVPSYRVVQPPAHGELLMGSFEKKARIAYRPDSYMLMNQLTNSERSVTLTITR